MTPLLEFLYGLLCIIHVEFICFKYSHYLQYIHWLIWNVCIKAIFDHLVIWRFFPESHFHWNSFTLCSIYYSSLIFIIFSYIHFCVSLAILHSKKWIFINCKKTVYFPFQTWFFPYSYFICINLFYFFIFSRFVLFSLQYARSCKSCSRICSEKAWKRLFISDL
jgi:hypothetical protein